VLVISQLNRKEFVQEAEKEFEAENTEGLIKEGRKKPLKMRPFVLIGQGLPVIETTSTGLPAASNAVLKQLAGDLDEDPPQYGIAFNHFGGGEEGKRACEAIDALSKLSAVNKMLSAFIKPLQQNVDKRGRIHGSLNINTETGRLSSRNPNLQNQPALEKDIYKIRDAFAAEPGNLLIVADYGQLELRVLAHM